MTSCNYTNLWIFIYNKDISFEDAFPIILRNSFGNIHVPIYMNIYMNKHFINFEIVVFHTHDPISP